MEKSKVLGELPDLHLITFDAVRKYKSVGRAYRRGDITVYGMLVPHKPFNNRKNTSRRKGVHSRTMNERKKQIYGRIKGINYGRV